MKHRKMMSPLVLAAAGLLLFAAGMAAAHHRHAQQMQAYKSAVFVLSLSGLEALSTNNSTEAESALRSLCRESAAYAMKDPRVSNIFGDTLARQQTLWTDDQRQ
jgi:hypothetical protein